MVIVEMDEDELSEDEHDDEDEKWSISKHNNNYIIVCKLFQITKW